MHQSMNNTSAAADAMSGRVIDEIAFQASILALHAAIESASNGEASMESLQDTGEEAIDDRLHRLVERARRRPAGSVTEAHAEFHNRPDSRGL
jgi:hypothetical protein